MIYLICFDEKFWHARHYLGFVDLSRAPADEALSSRLAYHRAGKGSRLLKAVTNAGIGWRVVRTWENGSRTDERRLKNRSSTRLCPVCTGDSAWGRGILGAPKPPLVTVQCPVVDEKEIALLKSLYNPDELVTVEGI